MIPPLNLPMTWTHLFVLGMAVVCLGACRSAETPPPDPGGWLDPQALWVDAASPFTSFEGEEGSMLTGPGWAAPEGGGSGENWRSYAWVAARQATVWFTPAFEEELDFYARCLPYPFEAAQPPQTLTLLWNGDEVGKAELRPGWQEIRMPLPDTPRPRTLQELVLRFARTTKPRDVSDSDDDRDLAAACSVVAVVPRTVTAASEFLTSARVDADRRQVGLPVGGGLSVPVAGGVAGELRLEPTGGGCLECVAEIDLRAGGEAARLWRGRVSELDGAKIAFETPAGGVARLLARFREDPARGSASAEQVEIRLPEGFVSYTGRGRPADPAAGGPPHVFVYLVDTLRADALAVYGGPPDLTPQTRAFAEEAVVYENARAASSWTLPSVVSLLTGTHPFRHGVMKGDVKLDGEALPGMGRLLGGRGHQTVGISHSFVASEAFGIAREFQDFFFSDHLRDARRLRSQTVRKAMVHWLLTRHRRGAPIFAYLHVVDPHAPYEPPEGYRGPLEDAQGTLPAEQYLPQVFMAEGLADADAEVRHMKARYLGEVAYADRQFGRFVDLLRRLGLHDHALIAFVSDHGEEFAEHEGFGHGRTLFEEQLRVPLLVRFPGGRFAGRRVERPVSTVDLLPTVLAVAGGGGEPHARDGQTLDPGPSTGGSQRTILAEVAPEPSASAGAVDLRALVSSGAKCIQSRDGRDQFGRRVPEWRTFDLAADPRERAALEADDVRAVRCRKALRDAVASEVAGEEPERGAEDVSQETRDHLRALGYVE